MLNIPQNLGPASPLTLLGQGQAGQGADKSVNLSDLVSFAYRQGPAIIACFLLCAVIAGVYLSVAPLRYTASSFLLLDTRKVQLPNQAVLSDAVFDSTFVDSQIEVVKSENVIRSVIKDLKLTSDPEFVGEVESFFGSVLAAARKALGLESFEANATSDQELMRRASKSFYRQFTAIRVAKTYVIEIRFRSLDPSKAAAIANALADAYILDQLNAKFSTTRRASNWLKERIDELRDEAITSDRAVQDFKANHNIIDTVSGRGLLSEQQLAEVNTQLVSARVQTAEAKARLDRINEINTSALTDATVADSLKSDVINKLRNQYLDASKREAELSSRYGSDHLSAINLRRDMQQIERVTREELRRIAETYKSDYEIARSREQSLQASLDALVGQSSTMRQDQVTLRVLESSAQSYRTLYDSFLQRFVETTQQQSFPNTEARVITPAESAERTDPKVAVVATLAVLGGAFLGIGVAFAREQLDKGFRTSRQVEEATGIECFGALPIVAAPPLKRGPRAKASAPEERTIAADLGISRQVIRAPFSRFTETLRAIKVAADANRGAGGAQVIGIVSALPGEGKSTIAGNLASLAAHARSRTLLIDGDLHFCTLSQRFAPLARQGLCEILQNKVEFEQCLWQDPETSLRFLPAVVTEPIAHTSEVLTSPEMQRLLADARGAFDYIFVDLPPLVPVVDAKAVAQFVDYFLLVIQWGETARFVVGESVRTAEAVREKLLGAVLNKANEKALRRIDGSQGYSYGGYYSAHKAA